MLPYVLAKASHGVARLTPHAQTESQSLAVQTHEELHVLAAALTAPAEGDPKHRVVRLRASVGILASARQRSSAARLGIEMPTVYAGQHRFDVAAGEDAAQFDQRLAHSEAIAFALPFHPLTAVVVGQLAEKVERV